MTTNSTTIQPVQAAAGYPAQLDKVSTSEKDFNVEKALVFLQEAKSKITRRYTFDDNGGGYEGL
jgi:hypothetical protein